MSERQSPHTRGGFVEIEGKAEKQVAKADRTLLTKTNRAKWNATIREERQSHRQAQRRLQVGGEVARDRRTLSKS